MELDEFKAHWNTIQDQESQQQQFSAERLQQIIMNTTDTLGQLHSKSVYWKRIGNFSSQMLIGILAVVLLIVLIKGIYLHQLTGVLVSVAYLAILVLYCIVTMWVYKRQEQIFTIYNNDNVKATLQHTITAFKRFYLMFNVIYLFLYPAFFYSVIKVLMPYWHPSQQTVLITCAVATVVSLIGGHWYYKVKFFKKLRSLEANLKDLDIQES